MSLCSLDNVKAYLDIPITKKDPTIDDFLESLIISMSLQINNYCNTLFENQEHTEYISGDGTIYLYPTYSPITSISGIWIDSDYEWGSDKLVASIDYRIMNDENSIMLVPNSTTINFSKGVENVKNIYNAGYVTIPTDLSNVCTKEVVREYKRRKDLHIITKALEDGSATVFIENFLPSSISVLDRYRKVFVFNV